MESNGFYYQDDGDALTLLCAVDAEAVGASATIPEAVGGRPVAALTDFAFKGCAALASLRLPSAMKDSPALDGAIGDCPDVRISWIGDPADVLTVQVVTSAQGQLGEGVEWTVEGLDSVPGDQYEYTLTLDGEVIGTAATTEASYAAALIEPGEYQLSVQVSRDGALLARGTSAKLFVASRVLEMTVPETIRNGENLSVEVSPLDGALSYYILLTDEATGKSVGSRTLSGSGGTATFGGYTLSPGEYRVTGYVYGNGYALTVPAVEKVTVSDTTRPACPAVKVPDSVAAYRTVKLSLTGGDYEIIEPSDEAIPLDSGSSGPVMPTALMRVDYKAPEGSGNDGYSPFPPGDMTVYEDTYTLSAREQGGKYSLSFCLCVDGVWSDWSPAYTMDVTAPPMIPDPTVAFYDRQTGAEVAEADLVAGRETEIRVSSDMAYIREPSLSFKNGDSWEKMERFGGSSGPNYASIIVPVRELIPGQYKLIMDIIPRGGPNIYSVPEDGFTYEFTVSGEGVELPELSVDKTEAWLTDDTVMLTIHAEGCVSARIERMLTTTEGQRHYGSETRSLDEDSYATFVQRTFYDDVNADATLVFKVSVSKDGVWSPYARISLPLHPRPQLAAPQVNISGESLTAGQELTISFPPVVNATRYETEVRNDDGSNSRVYYWDQPAQPDTPFTLPGYALGRGRYRVRVTAYGDGYRSATGEAAFAITGTRPAAPSVTADRDEIHLRERVTFTVAGEGIEAVRMWYGEDRGQGVNPTYTENSTQAVEPTDGAFTWSWQAGSSMEGRTITFQFATKQNGVWSNWREKRYTVLGLPELAQAEILCEDSYPGGADVSFTFAPVANAQRYEYEVYDPNGDYIRGNTYDEPTTVSFNGYTLEPGTYRVTVDASADNYIASTAERTFTVTSKAPAPSVTVDKAEPAYRDRVTFTVACPGAEQLMARISNDRYVMDYSRINVFEDPTDWTVTANWTGARSYAFAALVDGRWTAWSDPITLTVEETPSQQLPQPLIGAPATIQQGQDLSVSVDANGASEFRIYAYDAQDEQVFSRYFYTGSEQITIPGYRLSAGTAKLRVEAYGQGSSSTAEKTVSVTSGTRPTPPALDALSRTETKDNDFSFNIPAEGAERIAVRYYRSGDSNDVSYNDFKADGDPTVWTTRCSTSGEVWKYAFARKVNGVWSGWSAICTVQIAQREALRPVVINAPETLAGGKDLSVSFTDPDNGGRATGYEVRITKPDGNTVNYWDAQPGKVYTLDGLDLAEGDYTVRVTARASLYDNGVQTATVAVTGPRAAAPNVTRSGSETVHSGEKFSFTIGNVGGERIAWRKYRDDEIYSSGRLTVREDDTLWEISADAGIWTYRFALLKDGAWSDWSEPVKVTVEAWQAMDLAAPQVQPLPGQIADNADLTVTVTGPEEAQQFRVALLDAEENTIDYTNLYEPGEVTFPGYRERSLGMVRVRVVDYGDNGSRNQSEDAIIQVVAGSPGDAPQVTPPEVTESPDRQGSFTFAVNAPGADRAVVRWYRRGYPNDMGYAEFELDAAGAGEWTRTAGWFGTGEWRISFAVRVNGAWSRWSPFTGVTVG